MSAALSQQEKIRRGGQDSWRYFQYMSEFVGFTQAEADTIRETGLIIEKYIPHIVGQFYSHLLSYPPTREHFLKPDGSVDQEYLQLRMHHLTNFWRRTAAGRYDEEYARYIAYVGLAHTSHGADPNIYIAERYVIGQVGFMQHAITTAFSRELHEVDPQLEVRAQKAWNLLMMVILEMLSRAYASEHESEIHGAPLQVNHAGIFDLAVDTYERGLGLQRPEEIQEVAVAQAGEIPDGERKIVQVGDVSIGVFHHKGGWYALRNSCLHRGGPVCTGLLVDDVITCPWHGFQYNVTTGQFLVDPTAKLKTYPVEVRDGTVYLQVPVTVRLNVDLSTGAQTPDPVHEPAQADREAVFVLEDVPAGKSCLVSLDGEPVAVFNVGGVFYATQDRCTHVGGPLHEGKLSGSQVTCPWHGSCFDVTTGTVTCGPASANLRTYRVVTEGRTGRVEPV